MKQPEDIKEFLDLTIAEIFADRYSRYSKYIIQDRALPDVRDGLKPVQRRILYSMHKEGNLFDKQFRKSAKTVGNVIGNYHPHGDSSVYEAMVRMTQDWKVNQQLVLMHGNNGSIDGDSAAAMRYTEAKLSKYSETMLANINENTVMMIPNFDDTELEPTVLPTKIPNLLINGSSGISAGYATDIPPHNPGEIVKAAIKLNKNPKATTSEIMKIVKGPDFPTGPIVEGLDQIKQAYKTGRGKIVMRAVTKIEKNTILITALPYDVNKANLVQKIDLIRYDKKIDGIVEVIDQSNRDILEIAITCKKDANKEVILNYLFKNTDLQKNYNFNMIAIINRKPKLLSIVEILNAFIEHRKDVIIKRSDFRLERANTRLHIVEGLIKAVDILDEIVAIIRKSKDKQDSKQNIIASFGFTEIQAEAIVMMQLYRLSNTDMSTLLEEQEKLTDLIKELNAILNNDEVLRELITTQLEEVYQLVNKPRKTKIQEEVTKITFDESDLIKSEATIVSVTKNGYIKRSNLRSYLASTELINNYEDDIVVGNIHTNTKHKTLVFFDDGTYVVLPTHEIAETKWRDDPKHISSFCKINDGVKVIGIVATVNFKDYSDIITVSHLGYASKIKFGELEVNKLKQKIKWHNLKQDDKIVSISVVKVDGLNVSSDNKVLFLTNLDRYVAYDLSELEYFAVKRMGKKLMPLRKNEELILTISCSKSMTLFTDNGGYVHLDYKAIELTQKPKELFANIKSLHHTVIKAVNEETTEVGLNVGFDKLVTPKSLLKSHVGERVKTIEKKMTVKSVEEVFEL